MGTFIGLKQSKMSANRKKLEYFFQKIQFKVQK